MSKKKIFRFPRLYLTQKTILFEKILHHTYNRLVASKRKRGFPYEVYRDPRFHQPQVRLLLLAQELEKRKIDPVIYLKVLSNYGFYQNKKYLPHPTWLSSQKALKVYSWLWKKERQKYGSEQEWRYSMKKPREEYIKEAMRNAASMVKGVRGTFNLKLFEALVFLRDEVNAWYWATFLSLIKRKHRRNEILDYLWYEAPELRRNVIRCTKHFLNDRRMWMAACKILQKKL